MKQKNLKRYFLILFFFCGLLSPTMLSAQDIEKLANKEDRKKYDDAITSLNNKDFENALLLLGELKSANPGNLEIYFYHAEALKGLKSYKQAKDEYITLQNLITNKLDPSNNLDPKKKQPYIDLKTKCESRAEYCRTMLTVSPTTTTETQEPAPVSPSDNTEKTKPVKPAPVKPSNNVLGQCNPDLIEFQENSFTNFSSDNSESQKTELKEHVAGLYSKSKYKAGGQEAYETTGFDMICVNKEWLSKHATNNYQWFEDFKEKEDELFQAIGDYNEELNIIEKIKNDKNKLIEDKDYAEKTLRIEEQNLDRLNNYIDKDIKEGLLKKLATIPNSIVMVGRINVQLGTWIKNPQKRQSWLSEKIDSLLKEKAVESVTGFKFSTSNFTYKNQLSKVFQKTLRGKARTTDTYYKPVSRKVGMETYIYKIVRIEVNPYDTSFTPVTPKIETAHEINQRNKEYQDMCAFIVLSEDKYSQVAGLALGSLSTPKDLGLRQEEIDYIKFLQRSSEDLNNQYYANVQKAAMKFDAEMQDASRKKDSFRIVIDEKNGLIASLVNQMQEKDLKLQDSSKLLRLKAEVNKRNEDYIQKYNSQITVTNQLCVERNSGEALLPDEIFMALSEKCFRVVEDLKKNEISISVTDVSFRENQNISQERASIKFDPIARAYQVLSLNIVQGGEEDQEPSYFLNVAFEVKYNPIKTTKVPATFVSPWNSEQTASRTAVQQTSVKKDKVHVATTPPATPKPVESAAYTEGAFTVDKITKTMTENANHVRWRLFPSNPTSVTAFRMSKKEAGYELPSFNELRDFFSKIAYQEKNNNPFFSQMFGTSEETAYFASSEKTVKDGTDVIKCLKVFFPDFRTQEDFLEEGESVYVLMINRRY